VRAIGVALDIAAHVQEVGFVADLVRTEPALINMALPNQVIPPQQIPKMRVHEQVHESRDFGAGVRPQDKVEVIRHQAER